MTTMKSERRLIPEGLRRKVKERERKRTELGRYEERAVFHFPHSLLLDNRTPLLTKLTTLTTNSFSTSILI